MRRLLTASRLEVFLFAILAVTLFLRYPVHFALRPPFLMDFEIYRGVAERIAAGASDQVYAPLGSVRQVFKYAPVWALLWAPFGWLPRAAGAVLWTSGSILCLLVTLILSARICRKLGIPVHPLTAVLTVFILVRPLAEEMGNGQVNLLWGCLIATAVAASLSGQVWFSACAMAAAVLLKLPALIFLPYPLLRSRWQDIGRILATAALSLAGASVLLAPSHPISMLTGWFRTIITDRAAYTFEIGNQSLFALLARFLTRDGYGLNILSLSQTVVTWLGLGLTIAGVARLGLASQRMSDRPDRFAYDCAILTVLMVLGSPICWVATYTALILPLFLGLAASLQPWTRNRRDLLAILPTLLLTALSLFLHQRTWRQLGLLSWRGEGYVFLVFMILPWLGLVLAAVLARVRWLSATRRASSVDT